GAGHRVDLSGVRRQRPRRPDLAAVLACEYLAGAARAVHAPGLPLVERDREHRRLGFHAHVDARPARPAVAALEQRAQVALEIRATGHPDGPRIAGHLADVAAIRLPLGIERLESRAGPVHALIRAAKQAGAPDREHRPRPPAADQHAVHVHGVVVHVLAVAHVLPVLTAVEASDDAADLDRAVDLVRVGGVDRELEHALRGIRAGGDGHLRETHGHRQLAPALAAIVAAI